MKIAYIDIILDGHHIDYLQTLVNDNENSILIIPNKIDGLKNKQYILDSNMLYKHPFKYIKWIMDIRKILSKEKVDIVHFLYGDVFYRYFGIGLKSINTKKIITFHQIRRGLIKDISLKRIFRNINKGIVHTDSLKLDMNRLGLKNVCKIEYPQFKSLSNINNLNSRIDLILPQNHPIITVIGGTREDKGLDILLSALNYVNEDFHLLIAGQEVNFKKEYIYKAIENYSNKVTVMLKYLTEDELEKCLVASDIIVLPYRKKFDGASGPLGEGVWLRKVIIGPNHGSLGKIILENKIGLTFEAENIVDLAKVITEVLRNGFEWNDKAEQYRNKLDKKYFTMDYKDVYEQLG